MGISVTDWFNFTLHPGDVLTDTYGLDYESVQIYETFRTVGRCKNTDDQLEIKKFTTPQELNPVM